ncbi:MAG: DNA polymerase III subunit alpha [Pseudomonadota bacterium]
MAGPGFIHLRAHSSYSLLEGAIPIARLVALAEQDKQPALALTDSGNLFGALEFSEKAASYGVQPIMGLDFALSHSHGVSRREKLKTEAPRLLALAKDDPGYRNLMALTTKGFMRSGGDAKPVIPLELLAEHNEGIILLTGGAKGPVGELLQLNAPEEAQALLEDLAKLFPQNLYVEIQRHGLPVETEIEPQLLDLAYKLALPIVATNSIFFAETQDFEAHDALLCIAGGRYVAEEERVQLTPEFRFKTRDEMAALFSDLPEALQSTVEIARRCAYRPRTRAPILPRFASEKTADRDAAEGVLLRNMAQEGLQRRIKQHGLSSSLSQKDYEDRLAFELNVIEGMKYPGYFLIVSDFIRWAKAQNIPVGPGRGSGAGSLVAYALDITDLDPLRFGLLFERFLNPERVSMPDFDIDFCQERREDVIHYVQEKYGRDQVAQIITFGSMQARGVLRDVGRVLEMPYGQVDKLTKLVPFNPANPVDLRQAVASEPKLQQAAEEEPIVKRLLDIALKLEGLFRHASTHAAGIVIGDRPLSELVPLYRDPKSDMPVTQFNMKWVEQAGLVKFDFLGLKTLTLLQKAVELLKQRGVEVDLNTLPLDDKKTYDMLARGETVGVFQLESSGMRKAIADIIPDRFEDIIALVALYRPGPMANIPVYGWRKQGKEKPDYIHPLLEPILKETYGIIVYQEQVMQAAQTLAGYSLGEADLLRRAMGKKIREEMRKQQTRFVSGATERGLKKAHAESIFDLLAKFADYGFNKSHAAAYALVAYQTAYLKANYPVEFMAASMTLDSHDTDKLADMREEAKRLGIDVHPPDINLSHTEFAVSGNTIYYALSALKGMGRAASEDIVGARGDAPFKSLDDFVQRLPSKTLNKRMVECLAAAGAFDRLELSRARLFAGVDAILGAANEAASAREGGQGMLFTGAVEMQGVMLPQLDEWLPTERLQHEHAAVGFYFSGHPLDDYGAVLQRMRVQPYADFCRAVQAGATAGRLAASVIYKQEKRTKSGNKIGILGLSDPSGSFEIVCFQDLLTAVRDILEPGTPILIQVGAEMQGDEVRIRAHAIEPLDKAASKIKKGLRVFFSEETPVEQLARRMPQKGEGEVSFVLKLDGGSQEIEIRLPGGYSITPQTAGALKAVPGILEVQDL